MQRITPADENQDPQLARTYDHIRNTRGYVSNILKAFSHAPEGLACFAALGEYARYKTQVPDRTREMMILGIGRGIQYAWTHHYPHAVKAGVTQEELDAINEGRYPSTLSAPEKAAIRYGQEFANGGNVSDETFAELKKHYSERQITDLTLIAAYFIGLGASINAFRMELEPELKPMMKPVR
jgi:4-carboxymuconolactone decarboxylase